jgi:glycosyltransferase involved in cell wall biosynthesis
MTHERPILFVTNYAPPFRVGAFAQLHEREEVVFALVGGAIRHAGNVGGDEPLPFPTVSLPQRGVLRAAASGRFRAVIAGLSGRLAPAAAWAGARRAGVPFVLWAPLWAHPRTPAHALSYLVVRHLYRDADAIVTYGPHVSAYVRSKGARRTVVEAPQSVDDAFWSAPGSARKLAPYQVAFVGRLAREKGVAVLLRAWRASGLSAPNAALVLVGGGPFRARAAATGAVLPGDVSPAELRNFYAGSDVVVLPSIPTRDFREPWGLVVNEAFDQGVPVIASDAVGAAAGGLVRHEETGLVVPAGDDGALAAALRRLADDAALRTRLGAAAREAVRPFNHAAWAAGMSRALAAVGASRRQEGC